MVFSTLQAHEKEAFFSLLDEYFQSRPEIFANLSNEARGPPAAVSAAMHRASDVTSKLVSAGLRHTSGSPSNANASGGGNANTTASESEVSRVADRVAAFSLQRNSLLPSPASSTSNTERSSASGLSSVKKMGDVDTSSTKNFFVSLRNSNNVKSASPPPPAFPPAFAQKQSNFAPPPVRRTASTASPRTTAPEYAAPPPPPPPPRPRQQEEEVEEGDWADVIYDYESADPGDLKITQGEVVLVTERTSDDWWTGEVNGKKGLFPASYVKLR